MTSLAGAPNFRAVAPLPTHDGRHLRPDTLYRSGVLAQLTEADLAVVETLSVKLICDLRSSAERHRFPSRWPGLAPARTIVMPGTTDREAGMQPLIDRLAREPGPEGAYRAMLDLYAALPRLVAPVLSDTTEAIITGWGIPLLVHCHVGKDRTGVTVALLLAALGIEREAIVADYLETANRIDIEAETKHVARSLGNLLGRAIDPGTLDCLGRADPAYIETMFTAIDRQWGGIMVYFEALGLTASGRERLQARLLA